MPTKGISATYTATSNIDLADLLTGTRGEKIWTEDKPLNLRIFAAPAAWSTSWTGPEGKERYRLLRAPGGAVHLIDVASGTVLPVDKLPARSPASGIEISWRDARHPRFGPLRRAVVHLALSDSRTAVVTVEAQPRGLTTSAPLTHLWLALAPWLGEAASTLGLPVAMRLELLDEPAGTANLHLDALQSVDLPPDAFELPSGLREITRQSRRWRLEQPPTPRPPNPDPLPVPPPALFTGLGPETVKVIFNQTFFDAVFADARNASSYITGFSGTRFNFPTADWFTQIVQNAPVPDDSQTRSVIPSLMTRAFLAQVCGMLDRLDLSPPIPDAATLADTLPDTDEWKRLKAFLSVVSRRADLRSAFGHLLERIIPGLGCASPPLGSDDNPCVSVMLASLESVLLERDGACLDTTVSFASHPLVLLAEAWYGLLLPSINVRPKHRTRQEVEDAVAVFHANGEVTIDELAELVDISLTDFEHSIAFGNQPLFTPPAYVDTAALRAIGQLQPWFRQLENVRFGFLTELSLAGAEVSCDIDVTPALTPVTVILGFFCPPCVLSLFLTGSASASIEDARFPVFLYLEQDPLRLDPPRWRTVFAEPQIADVDANVFVIGFNVILALIINVIGNIVGGFVLNEILKSFGAEIGDAVDGMLEDLPVLDAGTIARLGRDPDLIFPRNEESRVAYEAPPRAAGGYQFETFRQAVRGMGGPLEFPAAGGTLDTALALVLGSGRAGKHSLDVTWPSHFGPFVTRKPDGSVSEIDWWAEAPDQTGMPPRPPQAQPGPPSGLLLIPQNVGQRWWTFSTILDVHITWLGWRDLTDSPANQPVADVLVSAWCRGEAIEAEIIMYEECQDVTHLAEGLMDRWRGPRGPVSPMEPEGPGDPAARLQPGDPDGLVIAGPFLRRVGRPGGDSDEFGPGWADRSTVGYWFDPRTGRPRPDDPGPPPVPGTLLCRNVVTLNARERETWVEASLQFTLPVFVGLTEIMSPANLDQFVFLPAIRSALGESYPAPERVSLNLFATGPLQTLTLPANHGWIRDLLLEISTGLCRLTGISTLGPFDYSYGIDAALDLRPERFQQPQFGLRLASATTWPPGAPLKQVAFKWILDESLLGRA